MKYSFILIDDFFDIFQLEDQILKSDMKEEDVLIFLSKDLTSLMDPKKIKMFLKKIIKILKSKDIIYLSYFLESCEDTKILGKIGDISIIESFSPMGFSAVASTVKKWKKIAHMLSLQERETLSSGLNSLVISGEIEAVATWPRIFEYNLGEKNSEYPSCRIEREDFNINKVEELSSYYFLISLSFFSIFLLYLYHKKN